MAPNTSALSPRPGRHGVDRLAGLGEGQRGVWTWAEAVAAASRGAVQARLRSGEWQSVWPGVLADGGFSLSRWQQTQAAVLAGGPGATAYGRTAARYWQLPLIDDDDPATGAQQHLLHDVASVGCRRRRDGRGGALLLPARLALADSEVDGSRALRVTRPLRTLWDLARLLTHEALVCALDDALRRGLVDRAQLQREVRQRAGHPGAVAFAHAVRQADGRAESPLETLGRLLLLPGLPGLVPQHEVLDDVARLMARIDLADPAACFGVETDGRSVHDRPQAVAADRWRADRLAGQGWVLVRVTWFDVRVRPAATLARVLRSRARSISSRRPDT